MEINSEWCKRKEKPVNIDSKDERGEGLVISFLDVGGDVAEE